MAEETVKIPIGEATMEEFKKARSKGEMSVEQKTSIAVAEAEEVEEEKVTEEEKPDAEKPKSRGGFQKKIDRLVKLSSTLEEKVAAAEKRAAEAEAKINGKGDEKKESAPDPNAEPMREQFQTESEFIRALTKWEVRQEIKAEREEEERAEIAAKQKEAVSAYNKKAIETQARYDDWKEVMSQDIALPSIVGDAIIHTIKNGPNVAYYLGKHPEVCEEMMNVHPLEAVAMAVKISEKLAGEEKKEEEEPEEKEEEVEVKVEEKPAKKVFTPITPVTGGTSRSSVPLDKAGFDAYKKGRAAGRVQ